MSQQVEDFERRNPLGQRIAQAIGAGDMRLAKSLIELAEQQYADAPPSRMEPVPCAVEGTQPQTWDEMNLDEGAQEMCFEASERRHVLSRDDRFAGE